MKDKSKILANFFQKKFEAQSQLSSPLPNERPTGLFDFVRPEWFQAPDTHSGAELKTHGFWADISANIYVSFNRVLSVVVACYDKETILWLDDHENDSDFEAFVSRERLFSWPPDRLPDILTLLTETKFNYLGWPELIRSVGDIPFDTDSATNTSLERGEDSILAQIQEPTCINRHSGLFELNFFYWTRMGGKIYKMQCFLGENRFDFKGIQVANRIGQYAIIR